MKLILLCTNDKSAFPDISKALNSDYKLDSVSNRHEALESFKEKRYEYLLIDLNLLFEDNKTEDIRKILKPFWQVSPDTEVIVLTTFDKIRDAVDIVRAGATDYLTIPVIPEDLNHVLRRSEENNRLRSELNYLRDAVGEITSKYSYETNSAIMRELYGSIRSVASTDSTILITGETGTGKGIIAKLIHQQSKRNENQFISIHCGAIPDTLLESELFGHEKGAFTGAVRRKLGKFEIAFGGTIFLDEIGTISTAMQIKLLQVLQDKIFYRVGGESIIKSNVRIIAATNSDLSKMIEEEKFRSDLYYRLNVFQIEVPPLRERKEDIPIFISQILDKLNKFYGKNISSVHTRSSGSF